MCRRGRVIRSGALVAHRVAMFQCLGGWPQVVDARDFPAKAEMAGEVQGAIGSELHIAARTRADGACALHAVFGAASVDSGEIRCPDVRRRVAGSVGGDISTKVSCCQCF